MAVEIVVPRLGWSMDEGVFGEWLFKDGDTIRSGDMLFIIEGDKAAQEVESFDEGILRIPDGAPQAGDPVVVGQVLGFLVAQGETTPALPPRQTQADVADPVVTESSSSDPAMASANPANEPRRAGPAARRLARQMQVEIDQVRTDCPTGRITTNDIRRTATRHSADTTSAPAGRVRITPRARRVARELNLDWRSHSISGSGRNGRIREADVRRAAQSNGSTVSLGREVPISPMRRTIAERMLAAWHQAAPVTLNTKADATNLLALRESLKDQVNRPTVTDCLVRCAGRVLPSHPDVMGQWRDDHIWIPQSVDIGFAVHTDNGLVVPVVRQVDRKSFEQIAAESAQLVAQARNRQLSLEAMRGGVFTISNLGSFGIDSFSPVINLPQSAILGVCRIQKEAVVENDSIVIRPLISLSLTFDHRVIDGSPAAAFLAALVREIEEFQEG